MWSADQFEIQSPSFLLLSAETSSNVSSRRLRRNSSSSSSVSMSSSMSTSPSMSTLSSMVMQAIPWCSDPLVALVRDWLTSVLLADLGEAEGGWPNQGQPELSHVLEGRGLEAQFQQQIFSSKISVCSLTCPYCMLFSQLIFPKERSYFCTATDGGMIRSHCRVAPDWDLWLTTDWATAPWLIPIECSFLCEM